MDKMQMAQKGAEKIKTIATKIFDIMSEFNYYDTEESDVTEVEESLIYDPYEIINSLTEIIDRLSTDLNIEREKVDFAISEATKKIKTETEAKQRCYHCQDIDKEPLNIYPTTIFCDTTRLFVCKVNGIELSEEELETIGEYYKSCEFGVYIRAFYKKGISEEEALSLGTKADYFLNMNDEISKKQAIEKILDTERIERIKQIHNTLCDMYGELFNIGNKAEIESELKYFQDSIQLKDRVSKVEFI